MTQEANDMDNNTEPDGRLYLISELDQMLTEINDGGTEACDLARDWLADLVMDGDQDVIATMLRGWQHEMEASLEREREGEGEEEDLGL